MILFRFPLQNAYRYKISTSFQHSFRNLNTKAKRITRLETATKDNMWTLPIHVHHPPKEVLSQTPILFICGWAGAGTTDFGALPKIIASKTKRNVITYDTRGLGNSKPLYSKDELETCPSNDLSLDTLTEDVFSIIDLYYDELGIDMETDDLKEFCVGGFSFGGLVSQKIAHDLHGNDPSAISTQNKNYKISSMTLVSSLPLLLNKNIDLMPEDNRVESKHFLATFDNFNKEDDKYKSAKKFFDALGKDFLSRPGREKLRDKLVTSFLESRDEFVNGIGLEWIQAQRRILLHHSNILGDEKDCTMNLSTHFDLNGIRNIPTCIIHGKEDNIIPIQHASSLHLTFGQNISKDNYKNQLHILEECDHFSWITHGQDLCLIFDGFLSTIGSRE